VSSPAGTVLRTIGSALASWVLAIAAATPASAQAPATTPSPVPSDEQIRKILVERVDTHRQSVGIVVGVIEPGGRRIVAYGSRAKGDARPLDGDTVFEIGSITKVFTSLLLADAVRRGEVALSDPVAKYLPAEVTVPERSGRAITLQDLATHTSGLPRMPDNFQPKDLANPYADYSVERMYQFLSRHQLARDVGSAVEYSNFGFGLLGHVLARRAGMEYDALVRTRVTGPLGMRHTAIALSPDMQARLAPGHSPALEPVPNWDLPTFAGAGALRSSANDMLTFLGAALGYGSSPLDSAFATMLSTRRPASSSTGLDTALGWQIFKAQETEVIWHNGGTGGYRTWTGYEPRSRTGVVVLTNAGTAAGPDDIGRHLLVPSAPLLKNFPPLAPQKTRTQTTVDAAVFERYVGRYQLAPMALLTITRDGNRFFVQLTGQPTLEIFAETEQDYFLKVVDAQLTFETDAQNQVVAVVLHQNGIDQRAPRIEGEPVVPKEVAVDEAVLAGYVGEYQLAPGFVITITRQQAKLFAQLTGQPSIEVFASGARDFFYKVVNAQLTFEVDGQGRVTAVVLHQLGRSSRAPRIGP
jgi:CubicO group peptidase (beta-lactamase class C family)